jgi:hypothetical protein
MRDYSIFDIWKGSDVDMRLAIVYLGEKLPEYVSDNLKYIKSQFVSQSLVFIGDSEIVVSQVSKIGVDTFLVPESMNSWPAVFELMGHPRDFRDGFWFRTLARFMALAQYMESHGAEGLLQIEADVFLCENFPFEYFGSAAHSDIAFPLESVNTGAASVLWLANSTAAKELVRNSEILISENHSMTDMTILGEIAKRDLMNFEILPTIPNQEMIYKSRGLSSTEPRFPGIFDALTIGLYLFGEDPKNNRGFRKLYQSPISHLCKPKNLGLFLDTEGQLFSQIGSAEIPIYCLHVHSKDRRLFKSKSRKRLMKKRINLQFDGVEKEFVPRIFLIQAAKSAKRRLGL